jgi:hypothetical protein
MFIFAAGAAGLDQITMLGAAFFADKNLGCRFIPDNAKKRPFEESVVSVAVKGSCHDAAER